MVCVPEEYTPLPDTETDVNMIPPVPGHVSDMEYQKPMSPLAVVVPPDRVAMSLNESPAVIVLDESEVVSVVVFTSIAATGVARNAEIIRTPVTAKANFPKLWLFVLFSCYHKL